MPKPMSTPALREVDMPDCLYQTSRPVYHLFYAKCCRVKKLGRMASCAAIANRRDRTPTTPSIGDNNLFILT